MVWNGNAIEKAGTSKKIKKFHQFVRGFSLIPLENWGKSHTLEDFKSKGESGFRNANSMSDSLLVSRKPLLVDCVLRDSAGNSRKKPEEKNRLHDYIANDNDVFKADCRFSFRELFRRFSFRKQSRLPVIREDCLETESLPIEFHETEKKSNSQVAVAAEGDQSEIPNVDNVSRKRKCPDVCVERDFSSSSSPYCEDEMKMDRDAKDRDCLKTDSDVTYPKFSPLDESSSVSYERLKFSLSLIWRFLS